MLIKASLWDLNAPQSEIHIHEMNKIKKKPAINHSSALGCILLKYYFLVKPTNYSCLELSACNLVLSTLWCIYSFIYSFLYPMILMLNTESRFVLPMGTSLHATQFKARTGK